MNDLNGMIEAVSAKVHEAWMDGKRAKSITTRLSETNEELMVPYDQLSEDAKDLDRGSVRATVDAILAAGYEIKKAEAL